MARSIIAVDLQNDFTAEGGAHYGPRACVPFIKDQLLPFARERGYAVAEIISDYRATDPGDGQQVCVPGGWGRASLIPAEVKHPCGSKPRRRQRGRQRGPGKQRSVRENRTLLQQPLVRGLPKRLGPPSPDHELVLLGLVLEVGVLSTLQELHHRGYRVRVLFGSIPVRAARSKNGSFPRRFFLFGAKQSTGTS